MKAPKIPRRMRRRQNTAQFLPLWKRLLLLFVGWTLLLLGIVGLVLPVLQGWLMIFTGAAVLSLVSEIAYEALRKVFQRWPRGWRRVHKLRRLIRRWLHREEPSE